MNYGDANVKLLTIKVNNVDVAEDDYDIIEITFDKQNEFNSIQKSTEDGSVFWKSTESKFAIYLSQEDTIKLGHGTHNVQVRLMNVSGGRKVVVSSSEINYSLGDGLSNNVLGNEDE